MAGACRALGRLVVLGVGGSGLAGTATAGAASAGLRGANTADVSTVGQASSAPPFAFLSPPADDTVSGLPAVAAALGGGTSSDGPGLGLFSTGMALLALITLVVLRSLGDRDTSRYGRGVTGGARPYLGDLSFVLRAAFLVVVSLAWVVIAIWTLTS